jgi:hypothetical protein
VHLLSSTGATNHVDAIERLQVDPEQAKKLIGVA